MSHSAFARIFAYWLAVALVLVLTYPVTDDYRFGILTASDTVRVYLEMTCLIALVGGAVEALITVSIRKRSLFRSAMAFVLATVLLGVYGIVIPDLSPSLKEQLPFAKMHAHFLRDFMGIKFSWIVAPLCGLLLGACLHFQHHAVDA